ncbi:MAG: Na/Pi cotransporter family protein, partial [Rhodobacteraceae bacterium]|nr:Na/Pi cotransporter family protein [Paracoccaceae bacterium]
RMVARLVPEKKSDQIITLDQKLLDDPDAALISAQAAAEKIARILFGALGSALKDPADYRRIATLSPLNNALSDLEEFLSHIHPDHVGEEEERTYSALLHQTDHMARLLQRAQKTTHIQKLLDNHLIRRPTLAVGAAFRRLATAQDIEGEALRLARLHALVRHRKDKHRRGLLLGEHAGIYSLKDVFTHTDAMRWLDRSLHHAERVMHYQTITRQEFPSAPREAEGI